MFKLNSEDGVILPPRSRSVSYNRQFLRDFAGFSFVAKNVRFLLRLFPNFAMKLGGFFCFVFLWRKTTRTGEIAIAQKCFARSFTVMLAYKRDLLAVLVNRGEIRPNARREIT